jgi:hypothetical protein
MIEFDTSEVTELIADCGRVPQKSIPRMTKATEQSSRRIRNQMRSDARGIGHAPHFPRSITDEVSATFGRISAEIGPDKEKKQGALGNILYFGTSKNGPVVDINGPLDREAPRYEKAIADATEGLL